MKRQNELALVGLFVGLAGAYFYASHEVIQKMIGRKKDHTVYDETWINSVGAKHVYIQSMHIPKESLKLHGVLIENKKKTDRYVILVHGYHRDARYMYSYAEHFYHAGFNILIVDQRGHGLSEGNTVTMGWFERLDMLSWIEYLCSLESDAKIALFGLSMGAATVMNVSGEKLPPQVKVIVEDCGYTSVLDIWNYQLSEYLRIPKLIVPFILGLAQRRLGYSLAEASTIKQVAKAKVPMLFMHGDADNYVPTYMLKKLYQACSSKDKEFIIFKGRGHAEDVLEGDAFYQPIFAFIEKYM